MIILNGPPAPSPYLFFDNLEWGSSAAAVAAGWANSGGDWTQAGLEGSFAVLSASAANTVTTPTFVTSGECWAYCMLRINALANDITFMSLNPGVDLKVRVGGSLRITSGTNQDSSGGTTIVISTNYYVKVRYAPASTRAEFYIYDTSGVLQKSVTHTSITASANASKITFKGATSSGVVIDRVRVSSTDLGYAPSP